MVIETPAIQDPTTNVAPNIHITLAYLISQATEPAVIFILDHSESDVDKENARDALEKLLDEQIELMLDPL